MEGDTQGASEWRRGCSLLINVCYVCVCVCFKIQAHKSIGFLYAQFNLPYSTEILDGCGQALPLSAVISPVSLAASLRVNSLFSPSFLPVLTFSLSCPELCCMLLHQSSVKQQARFEGYRIVPCIGPQEVLRMNMREALVRARLGRRGEISAKVSYCIDKLNYSHCTCI